MMDKKPLLTLQFIPGAIRMTLARGYTKHHAIANLQNTYKINSRDTASRIDL